MSEQPYLHEVFESLSQPGRVGKTEADILNAPVITERVSEYQSRGLFGARHFDTYVWQLPIPAFDKMNDSHLRLVTLAKHAECVSADAEVEGLGFQKARRIVRQRLDEDGVLKLINTLVTDLLDGR